MSKGTAATWCWVVLWILACLSVNAQECPELASGWPFGPARAVVAEGDLAIAGNGSSLMVVDISDLEQPTLVGLVPMPAAVLDVAMTADGLALAAVDDRGFRVVDISDPTTPREVGSIEPLGFAGLVGQSGGYGFVGSKLADGSALFAVVDISHPAAPEVAGTLQFPWATIQGFDVDGSFAYLSFADTLRIVDISTAAHPVEVGQLGVYSATKVDAAGSLVFVNGAAGLRVIDVQTS